jgi:exonuclease I
MTNDALIEEINEVYRRLSAATEALARADRELAEYIRSVRLNNAEAILEAKNERTASLYLDGLLDTDEHRRLEADRVRADLDYQHARREVERLHLIVRLLGTRARRYWDERRRDEQEKWRHCVSRRPMPTPTGHPPAPVVPEATESF